MTATIVRPGTATATRTRQDTLRDGVLLAFRLVVGFLFLLHAVIPFGLAGGMDGAGAAAPAWDFSWYVGIAQGIGALLIAAGLFTRVTGFLLSGMMAFAYFSVHAPQGWNPIWNLGEQAALYSWIFLLFVAVGAGRFSVDALRAR
ncbi:DoxX family protein [Pseudonocardia pini]|uniref:DoxX family protein n=1 Tax=Pseudonocardia pini TaxID=2758030 RepID=UPI0015F0F0FF|nr:DoxX family protein [Pseudonocardia pini]